VVPLDVDSPRHLVERAAHQVDPRLTLDRGVLEELAAGAEEEAPASTPPGIGRGDLAEIVFTSGTTSEPKGCTSLRNLLATSAVRGRSSSTLSSLASCVPCDS
jgi:long-subunit acyl-CoA synthetase (AMP-forming)